jgi:diguanylate cyclase (GGDEF)-like protein/PAS domain S-box-containing protein
MHMPPFDDSAPGYPIRNLSLKTKMALAISLLFVAAMAALASFSLTCFTSELKESISRQQFSLVATEAGNIDSKLRVAHASLIASAANLPKAAPYRADDAQRFLDGKDSLRSIFDNGLFLFSRDGRLVAESPYIEGRRGRDISFRDYYKKTVATGKPHISSPYISTHTPGHPAIILTAPVFDSQHRLVAIMAGSFDLMGANFLGDLSRIKIGETGYLFLYDSSRTMIIHPDRSRILKQDVPPGVNKLFDKALTGFEGSGETVNSRGLAVLASFKHLDSTDWILGANFPVSEAYAPMQKVKRYFVTGIALGTIVILLLVWALMERLTGPLIAMTRHIESLADRSGSEQLIEITAGDEIGTLGTAFNQMTTTLHRQQHALKESERNFRALADNANDGMQIIIDKTTFAYANSRAAEITGYSVQELLSLAIIDLVHPDEQEMIEERYAAVARKETVSRQFETSFVHKDRIRVPVEVTSARTVWHGRPAELVIFRDITERKKSEEEIQQLAYYDTLTRLPNRTLLHDRLHQAIALANRNNRLVGVLFLDLDRFKGINDTLGHVAGDRLLKAVAERLLATVRESDTVSRLGGDEFIVILSGLAHEEDISKTAEKILAVIAEAIIIDSREIYTTASIGIAVFPDDGADSTLLLKNADIAMYQAKEQGRNNFQFFSKEMNVKALEHLMLETSLRRALERNELFLVYQPQMELHSGQIVGMEVLLRWRHPDLGVLAPTRFISLAEETGLIIPIGEWVLRSACTQNRAWLDAGYRPIRMAVNISVGQFRQQNFVEVVASILRETGIDAPLLELELTESMVMTNAASTVDLLGELKAMGVSLSIDDFGTGYSSLSYLKHFPIDRVKVDRSFVRDIGNNADDAAIAGAIIAMSHSMNLKVTAEGVEHQEQLQFLASRGCDEIQGYILAQPLPADELAGFLDSAMMIEA